MVKFILDNFDTIFRDEKSFETFDKMILDLSVRGKLVPQIEDEEPASKLLQKIKEEKERLIAEKVIKKEKSFPPITEDEKPFHIPDSWEWVRLKDIGQINPRNKAEDDLETGFIPMKLINDGLSNLHSFEIRKWKEIKNGFTHFANGDIVLAKITPCFENRKSVIIKNLINEIGAGTTELYVYRAYKNLIIPEFILNIFKTEKFINEGVQTYTGTAGQQRVKKDFFENYLISLPPLEEQERIVKKVEKLQELSKKFKEIYNSNEKTRANLKKSILEEIEKSDTNNELLISLEKLFENFEKAIKTKEDVKDIRNLVLSLSVRGKLVPQIEEEEPASKLLEKIKEEKERLIAEKVIKKEKPLPVITEAEKPFNIPDSWEWVRLPYIFYNFSSKAYQIQTKEYKKEGKFPIVAQGKNLIEGFCNIEDKLFKIKNPVIIFGDHTRQIKYIDFDFVIGADGTKILQPILINEKYFYYYLNSINLDSRGYGRHFKLLNEKLFPLPPLKEQERIVNRIDELMTVCDTLESKIEIGKNINQKLLASLLK